MSDATFKPVPTSFDFAKADHEILALWRERNVFKRSEEQSSSKKPFVFYDGPPGTNGRPHIGHIMQSALKDLWPRYKTMQGYRVLRKAGWDTHGLPVELTAESELGLAGKIDIERHGVQKFVEHCRKTVLRFRDDWVQAIARLGRFLDCDNDYLTMSNDFIQSDWWVVQQAFRRKLLYKDFKIVPYCSRCGTALSSHEVAQGYQDITDLTLTAKFRLVDDPKSFILAWTTTPWTLLGNVALAINGELEYSKVKVKNKEGDEEILILASGTMERNEKALGKEYEIVETFRGKELVGKGYVPLWDFSAPADGSKCHVIVDDDYVTTEDGTGVVHLALYGEDDFRLIKKNGLYQNQHVGPDGRCGPSCGQYSGKYFREEGLDVEIVKDLAARGLLFDKYRYEHSYPHCWRCKSPLMYFAKSNWFIRTTAIKETMISENRKINWQPPHIREGRFGNWLENNVDWAVSRDRYWGSPVNVWSCEDDPSQQICPASIKELQALSAYHRSTGKPIGDDIDLHIPVIDDVVFKDDKGRLYSREKGVLDCWFNAGVMPWGQYGFPAKPGSEKIFADQFPADFICEAIDQTRGWFYTLLAVSSLVDGRSSFKNVICTELILDANGKKMSKSLGNVIDPIPLIEKFGADAVRWTFYEDNPWQVKRYSEELPKEALRAVFIPVWNCYSFFVTYALLDKWKHDPEAPRSTVELDRWILSALRTTVNSVTVALEAYDVASAAHHLSDFIEALSNWYIRRSRKRFWKSEDDSDKRFAYATLYEVLVTFSKLIAPMAPFLAETIYQNLVLSLDRSAPDSVHLCAWPDVSHLKEEAELEREIGAIQEAASMARALRTEHNLKVRQPLATLLVAPADARDSAAIRKHFESLSEEVNVKEVRIVDNSAEFINLSVKPNWRALGPRFGKRMKDVNTAVQALPTREVASAARGEGATIGLDGENVKLSSEELIIEQSAKAGVVARSGRSVTVALSTELTKELIVEGNARELLSVIQRQRKSQGLEISDFVKIKVWGNAEIKSALDSHAAYVAKECLAKSLDYAGSEAKNGEAFDINGNEAKLEIVKI